MSTPRKRPPRPAPGPTRRPKVAGRGASRGIRPAQQDAPEVEDADAEQQPPSTEDAASEDTTAGDTVVEDVVAEGTRTEDVGPEIVEPDAEPRERDGEPEPAEPIAEADPAERDALKLRLAAVCAVLAAVCAGLAVYFVVDSGTGGTPQNDALTNAQVTKDVQDQVSKDLNAIMSYDYRNPGKTDRAAKEALGDDALAGDYSDVINVLKEKGPSQQLSVQTKVVKSGVIELTDDTARVLALASQNYSKGGEGARSQATSARLQVNATLDDNRWRITGIEQY